MIEDKTISNKDPAHIQQKSQINLVTNNNDD